MDFDLPSGALEITDRLADWAELNVLFGRPGFVSTSEVADVLSTSGVYENEDAEARTEDVWRRLRAREDDLKAAYPIDVIDGACARRHEWSSAAAYSSLLIADVGRHYNGVHVEFVPGGPFPLLFELVVAASLRGSFGGETFRFGWPVVSGMPEDIIERLRKLADSLGIGILNTAAPANPEDKDLGLDVLVRLRVGDELPGTLYLMTQCATGKHWRKTKTGEPSLARWKPMIDWSAEVMRAVAIPWRIGDDNERSQELLVACRDFENAMVLDRPRLVAGNPDAFLPKDVAPELSAWCTARIAELPRLGT